jgi:RND family efflux transporter MFP subunit
MGDAEFGVRGHAGTAVVKARPFWTRAACLTCCASMVLAGCSPHPPASPQPLPVVQVVRAVGESGQAAVEATGAFRWTSEAELSFAIPGTITRLQVDQGDVVAPGQVLAVIDDTAVRARAVQTAADLEQARKELRRYEPLLQKGFISSQQLDRLHTAMASAQAAHDSAIFDQRRARLISPVGGAVLRRTAQNGEVVQAGQAVVTVADENSRLVLRLPVASRELARIRIGAPAHVRLRDGPSREGQVIRIGRAIDDRTSTFEVDVAVRDVSGLRSGMIAEAAIAATTVSSATGYATLPAEAILEVHDGRAGVLIYDPGSGRARRATIRFGGFDGDSALVAGLPPGADVISIGAGFINDGQRVSVTSPLRQAVVAGGVSPR